MVSCNSWTPSRCCSCLPPKRHRNLPTVVAWGIRSLPNTRPNASSWAQPIDVGQRLPAAQQVVDHGQDMVRLPVPLAAPQDAQPCVKRARYSQALDQIAYQYQT